MGGIQIWISAVNSGHYGDPERGDGGDGGLYAYHCGSSCQFRYDAAQLPLLPLFSRVVAIMIYLFLFHMMSALL